ncbi:MAG: AAA family ATPase, partial [Lachnospiraceae bacterium]|nr:AAA family ATPase [Lachnospiraceae bacterium]
ICILYGLRRTGKTFLIRQAISTLPIGETAYIKIRSSDTMAMLNRDLLQLSQNGKRYLFIDEITLMSDFIDSASLLSDIYASSGMKIVLSGTDSLGFALSLDDELYDRAVMIHTTFIPFREYARLLGIEDVDEYIRYGGTFRVGELDFEDEDLLDEGSSFQDDETTRRYIDTSIARNIQHSLSGYRSGGHFRHLIDLYEAGELTNVINRLIEDMNHQFMISVLDRLDEKEIIEKLKKILDILDRGEMSVNITEDHIREIRQYLLLLDLIVDAPSETIDSSRRIERILFSQPGMQYCQAQALVYSLMKNDEFLRVSAKKRKAITDLILEEVKGRMLEEIILLETIKALPRGKRAFKLLFPTGEYDMVIHDENAITCEIYEIKHSSQRDPGQVRYLTDPEKCDAAAYQYGDITKRVVLYNGPDTVENNVHYQNIAEYLKGLRSVY